MIKKVDKNTSFSENKVFEYNGKTMDFRVPRVMGIVNVTPDSFYDVAVGRLDDLTIGRLDYLMGRVKEMADSGAYIIDIGAVSTRPGAPEVSIEEEKSRLLPVLKEVRKLFPEIIISIDTYRAEIAEIAAGEGADMINDISGGMFDPLMLSCIIKLKIPYVIMHIQGTPATMQQNPVYEDVVEEVKGFLLQQAHTLEAKGHRKIIIDPGFGFGKTVEHNYQLLSHLDEFADTGYPILAGLSRKSMINKVLGTKPAEALNGTTVLNTIALMKGAAILRVHDVEEAMQALRLVEMVMK
ncbi:MAG: dihydropteroate synthase [Bacteroidales bacterium]|jgi:dihydropteroate synthase|nr:dihydropteroate synthase [Bacteroidales bacterium]